MCLQHRNEKIKKLKYNLYEAVTSHEEFINQFMTKWFTSLPNVMQLKIDLEYNLYQHHIKTCDHKITSSANVRKMIKKS